MMTIRTYRFHELLKELNCSTEHLQRFMMGAPLMAEKQPKYSDGSILMEISRDGRSLCTFINKPVKKDSSENKPDFNVVDLAALKLFFHEWTISA